MTAYKSTNVRTNNEDSARRVPFSALLARVHHESDGVAQLDVPDDWMQGRSVFGGLQVAIALRAMRGLVPDVPLRALQTTFIAPVGRGVVTARAEIIRRGKSVVQVRATIAEGDEIQAIVMGVFGTGRASKVDVAPTQDVAPGGPGVEMPFLPGIVPNFIQHFRARWLKGAPPFAGFGETEHIIELDLRDPSNASEAHVVAIADFIPPLALSHLRAPVPGSSATWLLELLTDRVDHLGLSGWRVDGTLRAARDGYTNQSVMIWGPGGVPVAISHQSMLVFG